LKAARPAHLEGDPAEPQHRARLQAVAAVRAALVARRALLSAAALAAAADDAGPQVEARLGEAVAGEEVHNDAGRRADEAGGRRLR
jgi:hypothetical protein